MTAASPHHPMEMEDIKPILMIRSIWSTSQGTQSEPLTQVMSDQLSAISSCKGTHKPQDKWTRTLMIKGPIIVGVVNNWSRSWLTGVGFKAQLAGSANSYFVISYF